MSSSPLAGFTFERILNENARLHTLALLGSCAGQPALLLVEKRAFEASKSDYDFSRLASSFSKVEQLGQNDIYTWLLAYLHPSTDSWPAESYKMTLIAPASDAHIRKYSPQVVHMIKETPELYKSKVLPYIQSFPLDRLQWVYNTEGRRTVLDHVTESERIVFEDPDPKQGFIIVPDLKWDQRNPATLYLQAIVHPRDVRSLRDLTTSHLPMLRHIRRQGVASAAKYGVVEDQVRCYVHYQPSYYHFHVHITHVSFEMPSNGAAMHLPLDEIIDDLELSADAESSVGPYYARRTLSYGLGEEHGLYQSIIQ